MAYVKDNRVITISDVASAPESQISFIKAAHNAMLKLRKDEARMKRRDNMEIDNMESRTQKIKRLKEEIESLEKEERDEISLLPTQRMAIELHRCLCRSNHIDECGWDYEKDWQGYAHKRWLDIAEKIDSIGLTIEQVMDIAKILGRVR